mgnify:CR=1 FL=1
MKKADWPRYSFYVAALSLGIFAYNSICARIDKIYFEPLDECQKKIASMKQADDSHFLSDSFIHRTYEARISSLEQYFIKPDERLIAKRK